MACAMAVGASLGPGAGRKVGIAAIQAGTGEWLGNRPAMVICISERPFLG